MWSLSDAAGAGAVAYWDAVKGDLHQFNQNLQTTVRVTDRNVIPEGVLCSNGAANFTGGGAEDGVISSGRGYRNPVFNELARYGNGVPDAYVAAFYRSTVVEMYALFEDLIEKLVRTFFRQLAVEAVEHHPRLKNSLIAGAMNHVPGKAGRLWNNRVDESEFVKAISDIFQDKLPRNAAWLLLDRSSNINGDWFNERFKSFAPDVSQGTRWEGAVSKKVFTLNVDTKKSPGGIPIQKLTSFRNDYAHSGRIDDIDWPELVKHFDYLCVSLAVICLHFSNIENFYNIPSHFSVQGSGAGSGPRGSLADDFCDPTMLLILHESSVDCFKDCLARISSPDGDELDAYGRLAEDQVQLLLRSCFGPEYRWVRTPFMADAHHTFKTYERLVASDWVQMIRVSFDEVD